LYGFMPLFVRSEPPANLAKIAIVRNRLSHLSLISAVILLPASP